MYKTGLSMFNALRLFLERNEVVYVKYVTTRTWDLRFYFSGSHGELEKRRKEE